MADPVSLTIMAIASTAAKMHAQDAAKKSADAQAESQVNLLERKQENQRQALIENTKRQQRNKERQLARVRASQAASGFDTSSGTQLAIFGDIESALDDQINEQTSQALDAIGNTRNQISNIQFGNRLRDKAHKINMWATGVGGVADAFSAFSKGSDQTGSRKGSSSSGGSSGGQ